MSNTAREFRTSGGSTFQLDYAREWVTLPEDESVVRPPVSEHLYATGIWLSKDVQSSMGMVKRVGVFLDSVDVDRMIILCIQAREFLSLLTLGKIDETSGNVMHLDQATFQLRSGGWMSMRESPTQKNYMLFKMVSNENVVDTLFTVMDLRRLAELFVELKILHNLYAN